MMKSEEKVRHLYLKKHGLIQKTLGEELRENQFLVKRERTELFLKVLCVILTIGYIVWIIKTIN